MNLKRTLPILGFLPSEIRFQNGNGFGGPSYGGDFTGWSGEAPSGETPSAEAPGPGLTDANFNIQLAGYTPSPESSLPSPGATPDLTDASYSPDFTGYTFDMPSTGAPSASPDLSEAFSPAYSPQISPEEGAPITGTTTAFAREGLFDLAHGGLTKQGVDFIGAMINLGLGYLASSIGGFFALFGLAVAQESGKALSEEKATIGPMIAGKFKAVSYPAVNVQPQAQPSRAPLQAGAKGAPITISPYTESKTEGLNQGLFSIPITPQAVMPSSKLAYTSSTAYPSLSPSLFGVTEKVSVKESGGLMIFPTSASGIEKEGSSLLKKQEPLIDTPSLLFLLGMGVVGMVLRKGARA